MKTQITSLIRLRLEKAQMEFLRLSKEEKPVVKSTPRPFNSTLLAVSDNEKILSKGLEDMAKHINKQNAEVKRMFTASSMMLSVNEHSMQPNRATDEYRREYEILIDCIMNSQKKEYFNHKLLQLLRL